MDKKIIIPSIVEMSVEEVITLQQSLQQVLMSGEAIQTYEIYAKLLKVFMLWAELEKQEYGNEMHPLEAMEYIVKLMKSGELKVKIVE